MRRPLAALALACASCSKISDPCFTPGSTVEDARILGVRVDPPEALVDLEGGSVSEIEVRALVVTSAALPLGERSGVRLPEVPATARLCLVDPDPLPDARPDCPPGAPVVAESPALSEQQPLVLSPPIELLRAARDSDPLRGLGGLRLRLQLEVTAGQTTVSAVKTLLFRDAARATSVGSLNHAVEVSGLRVIAGAGAPASYSQGQVIEIVAGRLQGLRPVLSPGAGASDAVEEYEALDASGSPIAVREHVTYRFYGANALFFGRPSFGFGTGQPEVVFEGLPGDEADEPAAGAPDPAGGLVSLTPVFPGEQNGVFWIVARDGRGAEGWLEVRYVAHELRSACTGPPPRRGCPQLLFGCF